MGRDVSAMIAFGVDCGTEESPWLDEIAEDIEDNGDFEHQLAKQAGFLSPYQEAESHPDFDTYDGWAEGKEPDDFKQRVNDYYDLKKRLSDEAPVELDFYGGEEFSSYVIIAKNTLIHGGWEGVTQIDVEQLVIPDNIEEIQSFCESVKLKPFEDPKWILYARYF